MPKQTVTKTATKVRDLSGSWQGHAALYRLDPPVDADLSDSVESYEYVVVSAVNAPFSGPETYVFGCDENGDNVDFLELDGSFRGGLDHTEALNGAGYEVA